MHVTHLSSPIVVSIEDPFDQDDWPAWSKFTASVGIQVRYCTFVIIEIQLVPAPVKW